MKQIIFTIILILALCFAAFAQANENTCPKVEIVFPEEMLVPGQAVIFAAEIDESAKKYNLGYEWTFSKGKIIKGQGTSKIEFAASEEDEGSNITVAVKIIGLPKNCSDTISHIVAVIDIPEEDPLDEFGKIDLNIYRGRLDSLLARVESYPNAKGLIQLKFNKNDSQKHKKLRLKNIQKHLEFRNFDLTLISLAIFEDDFEEQTILWIIPPGAKPPKAVTKDYKIIKAEEIIQKINELFPKK